ncbi:fructoselysine kinase [bacterium M00.F.Ca.ET.228.01.1.1]|uniref:PfkB family carbohydrate kinase n=1 Tax=Paraburkholderia phenoliruptrix TaxID=252970 RepID=UPI001091C130|nr:PfkB family carbohydrate kinase [Paraburkholderia phenoliruptrix]TGP42152.1 fructoselysine kinase [bacterium M00.F.Ca.ET.228.01.1.1]TGR99583.1 fructoselysine kinase [bacterium M00.F.Ca.ET.191.01.1.1]TGU03950.1 fructoselysine kinase [bacterium M00.F.Ca.ET.155.01.1.1]MBW0448290.1 hypothetical protein [Paraburkholderia phenoliruptrix]MBW9099501.1 hypothetical protein [Paraburkholderia phenoliruptrix]
MSTRREHRIATVGDNTVDVYTTLGMYYPGGNAVNVAVFLKRLGIDSSYVGNIGDDEAGAVLLNALNSEAIDLSRTRVVRGPNAWAAVRHEGSDRTFLGSDPGVCQPLLLDNDDMTFLATHDIVHTTRYSGLEAHMPALHSTAGMLSFDFSDDWSSDYIARVAPHVDLAFLSCSGLQADDCKRLARQIFAAGPREVVLTRGSEGAMAFDGDRFACIAPASTNVIDTLGAGDGLISGYLAGRVGGEDPHACLTRGIAYAAHVCGYEGAFGYVSELSDALKDRIAPLLHVATSTDENSKGEA